MEVYRITNQTIMSGLVVRYKEYPEHHNGLEISISRDGIMFQGYSRHIKNVDSLKELLDHAQSLYEKLRKEGFFGKRTVSSDIDAIPLSEEPECVVETRESHFGGDDTILETRELGNETSG